MDTLYDISGWIMRSVMWIIGAACGLYLLLCLALVFSLLFFENTRLTQAEREAVKILSTTQEHPPCFGSYVQMLGTNMTREEYRTMHAQCKRASVSASWLAARPPCERDIYLARQALMIETTGKDVLRIQRRCLETETKSALVWPES